MRASTALELRAELSCIQILYSAMQCLCAGMRNEALVGDVIHLAGGLGAALLQLPRVN